MQRRPNAPEPTEGTASHGGSPPPARAIAAPTSEPEGGFHTHLGEPTNAATMAGAARAARGAAQQDVEAVAQSLAGIAAALHTHTKDLERCVEGLFASDLTDPRTRMLE